MEGILGICRFRVNHLSGGGGGDFELLIDFHAILIASPLDGFEVIFSIPTRPRG